MKEDKTYLKDLLLSIVEEDDQNAYSKLFHLLYRKLVSFSQNYVQSREVAEEVVSDVFVKVWNNRSSLADVNDVESYLYIAVRNQSLNYTKSHVSSVAKVSESVEFNLNSLIDPFDPEKELEMQELIHNINVAVESLPTQCRAVFKLIKEDGFRYKQVAEILNISPRTVETQLIRALKRLDMALTIYLNKKQQKPSEKRNPSGFSISKLLFQFL